MNVLEIDVDIICPACSRKALLSASCEITGYMFRPKKIIGKASCIHCGYSHPKLTVVNADFYYQFPVGDRMFYARNKKNLRELLGFFKEGKKWDDELCFDFPATFYVHRDEIVKKIESLL
ncbi:hypothetical protein [Chitinophaga sp. LS1]|uniref:hypothetical protein n=1 Tax=Chitinophaga sp. LS1 TaxID=3051176 RepID=UPI002AAB808A|nr:hypothetical protein [Chitinophaga sp. LS1]WPV63757.1 hypothetical protein QQL36_18320 [Chitinophaga sp. LS1]